MSDADKHAVGRRAAELVEDGMDVGLGTGSTANHFLDRLGERVREGLRMRGVPTSERTALRAQKLGIPLATLEECGSLHVAIDGADQVDPRGDLIKGLGGALFREKRVAHAAARLVIIVDESKLVFRLGEGCPVPVEVEPASRNEACAALEDLGGRVELREDGDAPYRTDNGNEILDAHFGAISEASSRELEINAIPGVVDNGLFPGMTSLVILAREGRVREWTPGEGPFPGR